MLAEMPETAGSGGALVVVVVAIMRINSETFEAKGEVRKDDKERALAPALVFVDRAHDRGQNIRVPSTARGSKAETRISVVILLELSLAERGRLVLLLISMLSCCCYSGGGGCRFCACARPCWIIGNSGLEPRGSLGLSTH